MVQMQTCDCTCAMDCSPLGEVHLTKDVPYTYVCTCAMDRKHLGLWFGWSLFLKVSISRPFELWIHTKNKNGVKQTLQWSYDMFIPMIKETSAQNVAKEPRPNDVEMVEAIEEIRKLPTRNKIIMFRPASAESFQR